MRDLVTDVRKDDSGRQVRRHSARRQERRHVLQARRQAVGRPGASSSCRARTRSTRPTAIRARMEELKRELSARRRLRHRLRHDAVHRRIDPRSVQGAARRDHPGGDRGAGVPADLAGDAHSADRRAGGHRRHVRRDGGHGLQPQQPLAVRPGAGDRHRRRRRDRGRRGRRASHRARAVAQGGGRSRRWSEVTGPDHRHLAGADVRVHSVRVHHRHHRAVLPAVRPDDRRLDVLLGGQLADAQPGALCACC